MESLPRNRFDAHGTAHQYQYESSVVQCVKPINATENLKAMKIRCSYTRNWSHLLFAEHSAGKQKCAVESSRYMMRVSCIVCSTFFCFKFIFRRHTRFERLDFSLVLTFSSRSGRKEKLKRNYKLNVGAFRTFFICCFSAVCVCVRASDLCDFLSSCNLYA